jgi:hypothetical protein
MRLYYKKYDSLVVFFMIIAFKLYIQKSISFNHDFFYSGFNNSARSFSSGIKKINFFVKKSKE